MKNIKNWITNHKTLLKTLFVAILFIIVSAELLSIAKTISFPQMVAAFQETPLWKIGCMILIGLVAVLPMTGYDFTLGKMLHSDSSKRYILETSWIINTINNIAGFGGLVSMGLRAEFYGKKNSKEIFHSITKILLFVLSGLSIYSLLSLITIYFLHANDYVRQYWIWLLIGGLYFPIIYLMTSLKKTGILGGLQKKYRLALLLSSFLEWTGLTACFLAVGYLLGVSFTFGEVLPLLIAANVIGISSMIPGSVGSFDVIMILGLSALGIEREVVVLWILLFRLVYYVIPLCIGLFFFFKHLSHSFNDKYQGVPKQLLLEIFHKIDVLLLYFSGIMMVLSATIPQAFSDFPFLKHVNPFRFHIIIQFPSILLGCSLLIMGRGFAARVKRTYWPTIVLISAAILYSFMIDFSIITIIYLSLLLLIIVLSKSELYREQLVYSWEWLTIDGIVFALLTILYLLIGVFQLPETNRHPHHFLNFFLLPSEKIWLSSFVVLSVVIATMLLLIRFLQAKKRLVGETVDPTIVQTLLEKYGGNCDSELVFLGDKRVFLYPNNEEATVFLQFNIFNNKCVVMGDPSGHPEDFANAIDAFIQETDRWGYLPVFYEVHEDLVMILHDFGYDFLKMGEEALVDLQTFTPSGKKMRGTRAVFNKITKENYTFEVLEPPYEPALMNQLRDVSEQWLNGRKERGFSLGFFNEEYLKKNPIAVVKNQEGEIVSFANIIPSYTNEIGTIDLMRHHPDKAPSGSMDFLFLHLFDYMKEQGIHYFDLGMAPLANVGRSRKSFIQERIASLVYSFGSRFYSFQGLRDYKEKYASQWLSRYTLYSRESWLPYVIFALLVLDNKPIDPQDKTRKSNK